MITQGVLMDEELPAVDILFDADRLCDALGYPLRVDHLRHKPGLSVIARTYDQKTQTGWIASYHPREAVKLYKTIRRARQLGAELSRVRIEGTAAHELVVGPIELDRRLYEPLKTLGYSSGRIPGPVRVLNYNPLRRIVLALGEGKNAVVCKVGTPSGADAALLGMLASEGVPVVEQVNPACFPISVTLRYFPWFGDRDLSVGRSEVNGGEGDDVRSGFEAGKALARLHTAQPPSNLHLNSDIVGPVIEVAIRETVRRMPALTEQLHRIAGTLEARQLGRCRQILLHGDFSADQVLVDRHEIRLIDFDRCCLGPLESDLGSFAADELITGLPGSASVSIFDLPLTAALLNGYTSEHSTFSPRRMQDWAAVHSLRRLSEPFRACSPHWSKSTQTRVQAIENLLT